MTVKKLVAGTHPILQKQATAVTQFDETLTRLLQDLEDTMYATEAEALSAPQIGVNVRVAMVNMELEGLLQLINPKVIRQSEAEVVDLEGSVSIPNRFGEVPRAQMIVVESQDVQGNTVELTAYDDVARMILHMIDHLDGILFTSRVTRWIDEAELEAYFEHE